MITIGIDADGTEESLCGGEMRGNGRDHRAGGRVTDVRVDKPTAETAAYSKHKDER